MPKSFTAFQFKIDCELGDFPKFRAEVWGQIEGAGDLVMRVVEDKNTDESLLLCKDLLRKIEAAYRFQPVKLALSDDGKKVIPEPQIAPQAYVAATIVVPIPESIPGEAAVKAKPKKKAPKRTVKPKGKSTKTTKPKSQGKGKG